MNEDEIRRTLAELGEEPLPEAALTAVRSRVLGEIADRRRLPLAGWRWAAALAVLLVAVVAGWVGYQRSLRFETLALGEPAPPDAPKIEAPRPKPAERRIVARHRVAKPAGKPDGRPLVVKLLTPDPDVVIYWVMDSTGGGE